jgi:glycosyltransferase involved in cell wall biosynthesis
MSVSIVIPAINEAENLSYVLTKIPNAEEIIEVVLVDGGSIDGTVEAARTVLPSIRVVPQVGRGKSDAVRSGVAASRGEYVLIMDADGSHDPSDIPRFIAYANLGYEIVKGSRLIAGGLSFDETPLRRFLVRLTDLVANALWGTDFTDIVFGMFLIHRQRFLDLHLTSSGFAIESQCMARSIQRGYRIKEIPVVERPRLRGRSHLSIFRDGWYIGSTIFVESVHLLRGSLGRRVAQPPDAPDESAGN